MARCAAATPRAHMPATPRMRMHQHAAVAHIRTPPCVCRRNARLHRSGAHHRRRVEPVAPALPYTLRQAAGSKRRARALPRRNVRPAVLNRNPNPNPNPNPNLNSNPHPNQVGPAGAAARLRRLEHSAARRGALGGAALLRAELPLVARHGGARRRANAPRLQPALQPHPSMQGGNPAYPSLQLHVPKAATPRAQAPTTRVS